MYIVGQFHQAVLQMDIFHLNTGRKFKVNMREVPDSLNIRFYKRLRNFTRFGFGNCQNDNIYIMRVNILLQFLERANRYPSDRLPEKIGINIECAHKIEAALLEFQIAYKCLSEIAGTDQNHVVYMIQAQYLADFLI